MSRSLAETLGVSEATLVELRAAFDLFDTNKDGIITTSELAHAIRAMGQNPTLGELQDILRELDCDRSGAVEFAEYASIMSLRMKSVSDQASDLRNAFRMFDKDGSGTITAKELKEVMTTLGEQLTDEEAKQMVADADTDGDGVINYEEYVQLVLTS